MSRSDALASLPKVFLIGFNKCGTRTIHYHFKANGIGAVHFDHGRLALSMFRNLTNSKPLLTGYENFTAFSDMEMINADFAFEAYKLYPYLSDQYPDSVFILNTRNVEAWLQSRLKNSYGTYAQRWKRILKIREDEELLAAWRTDWAQHHDRVEDFFSRNKYRFFKFNIETDDPMTFNSGLPEFCLDARKYKVLGRTADEPALDERVTTLGL